MVLTVSCNLDLSGLVFTVYSLFLLSLCILMCVLGVRLICLLTQPLSGLCLNLHSCDVSLYTLILQ